MKTQLSKPARSKASYIEKYQVWTAQVRVRDQQYLIDYWGQD